MPLTLLIIHDLVLSGQNKKRLREPTNEVMLSAKFLLLDFGKST